MVIYNAIKNYRTDITEREFIKPDKVYMQVSYEKLIKVLSNVNKMAVMLSIKYKQINLIKSVLEYISTFSRDAIITDIFSSPF